MGAYGPGVISFCKREPSAVLLAGQLLGVLLYPFMEGSEAGRALFSLFGIAILGLVVLAVNSTRASHGSRSCSASRRRCCS